MVWFATGNKEWLAGTPAVRAAQVNAMEALVRWSDLFADEDPDCFLAHQDLCRALSFGSRAIVDWEGLAHPKPTVPKGYRWAAVHNNLRILRSSVEHAWLSRVVLLSDDESVRDEGRLKQDVGMECFREANDALSILQGVVPTDTEAHIALEAGRILRLLMDDVVTWTPAADPVIPVLSGLADLA